MRLRAILLSALAGISILGTAAESYPKGIKDKYLVIYALEGDNYEKIIDDFSLDCSSKYLKRINGDISPKRKVRIPLDKAENVLFEDDKSAVIGEKYRSLWSVADRFTKDKDVWREVRLLQRINGLFDCKHIPQGISVKIAQIRDMPRLEDILIKDHAVKGSSRNISFKTFPSYLRHYLRNKKIFRKQLRKRDIDMVVLHTTEHGKSSFMSTLKYVQSNRSCHYIINKGGMIYEIVKDKYKANGAGQSIWGGIYNLDFNSINIEIFSNNKDNDNITNKQYTSLRVLLRDLIKRYHISKDRILGHNQIALSYRYLLRQRKGDPGREFKWWKLGLENNYYILDKDILDGKAGLNLNNTKRVLYGQIEAYKKRGYAKR